MWRARPYGRCRIPSPAKRRELTRDRAGVDADHAVFERLGEAPHAAEVAGEEIGGKPYCVSLARRIASASFLKRKTGATGPNVSSRAISIEASRLGSTVGSKKVRPSGWRFP
jgi:hypothetical protein